jgi:hypothetical protein
MHQIASMLHCEKGPKETPCFFDPKETGSFFKEPPIFLKETPNREETHCFFYKETPFFFLEKNS